LTRERSYNFVNDIWVNLFRRSYSSTGGLWYCGILESTQVSLGGEWLAWGDGGFGAILNLNAASPLPLLQ